jgi:hypothetical protein
MEMATTSILGEIISGNNIGAGGYLKLGRKTRVGSLSDLQEWLTDILPPSVLILLLFYIFL